MTIYYHYGKKITDVVSISTIWDHLGRTYFIAITKTGEAIKIYPHEIKEIKIETI